jgi:F-type H+/Na+-transporting ATPase subunit alpha
MYITNYNNYNYNPIIDEDLDLLFEELEELAVNNRDIGVVVAINDGITYVSGLEDVTYGEMITIHVSDEIKEKGLVLNLDVSTVSAIILTNDSHIKPGVYVTRDFTLMTVPAGEYQMGRVVNPLGNFIDELIEKEDEDSE